MRCISLWQPYASLLVHGFKRIETRPFPAPSTVLGQRLGIASTKQVKADQRALFGWPDFQKYYQETGLPQEFDDLAHGVLLGTVLVHTCDVITEEDQEDVTEEEQQFGDWRVGRYAWRCRDPEVFAEPIPVSGQQGIWILNTAKVLSIA